MKKIIFIYGPAGSKKTALARQAFSNIPIGDTIELDLCRNQPKTIKDIGCSDSTKLIIIRNVPDEAALQRVCEIVLPLLEEESDICGIVFTSSRVKPFSLPADLRERTEIITANLEENELIHYDEERDKAQVTSLTTLAKYLNESIRIFKSFGFQFKDEELHDLIFNTKTFTKNKQVEGQEVTVGGLTLNKAKLMDMVELPENFEKLNKIAELAQSQIQNIMVSRRLDKPVFVLRLYVRGEDDTLGLKPGILDRTRKDNEVYIHTPKAKESYFFGVEFIALLRKYGVEPPRLEAVLNTSTTIKDGQYVVNWSGIKNREVNALGFPSFN